MPATEAQIARINELSQLARTAWFSLLGYLVFVGITLLGVKDADFFVPSRQTDLPSSTSPSPPPASSGPPPSSAPPSTPTSTSS